jgi:hypothetical protein
MCAFFTKSPRKEILTIKKSTYKGKREGCRGAGGAGGAEENN